MEDTERQAYESEIEALKETVENLTEQLGDALGLLQEIQRMAKSI